MPGSEEVFQKAMSEGHSAAWDQQWEKAAESYKRALKEIPGHPKALASLGLALYELMDYPESLRAYEQAVQASPADPVPLEKVGQLSERLGMIPEAIRSFMKAAELYIKGQDSEKALENWMRVTQLDPNHVTARSYMAMVHERLGHARQAATEYIAVAGLLQRSSNNTKAGEMITRAVQLMPRSPEIRQAEALFKSGQLLPRPMRSSGGTAALRLSAAPEQPALPKPSGAPGLDPIAEAQKKAVGRLAAILFDLSDDPASGALSSPRKGMQAIVQGAGSGGSKISARSMSLLHIGQAIDSLSNNQDPNAAVELEKALEGDFSDPAAYFVLGNLNFKAGKPEKAAASLQDAVKHEDYAFGARLLLGSIERHAGNPDAAAVHYLEALKIADSQVVPPDHAAEVRQLYEPIIEAQARQSDKQRAEQICETIKDLLLRPDWRNSLSQAREQLPAPAEGTPPMPLAEMMIEAQSGQVIEAISRVRQLARAGHLRSAMDEAFESFKFAPTYLPLHALIGDLLIQEGRSQDAITKYSVVAQAYSSRGEPSQAVNLLRRIIEVVPMDMSYRTRLIEQLTAGGKVDEAISEYLDLADIYYRLAELDLARSTYANALRLAQQGGGKRAWNIKLLKRMADIDMQHLDWRQALQVFEQLRALEPDDALTRKSLVDLNLRLHQNIQAATELENYLHHLDTSGRRDQALQFIKELVEESPQQPLFRRALAEEFRRANRIPEAVAELDALGESLLNAGDREGAIHAIESIIALNSPDQARYKALLARIKFGSS